MTVEVQGELIAAGGWLSAWRDRRDNPLAREAAWRIEGSARGWRLPIMLWPVLVIQSAIATCLIYQSYLHFQTLAPSASISRAYALNTLLWAVTTLLDSAVVVCGAWLVMQLLIAFFASCGFLTRRPGWGARLSAELAASPLPDAAVVAGAGLNALRLVRAPLVLLAVIAAADQLAGVCAAHQDVLFAPAGAGWPGAAWLWALLAAMLIAALKAVSGALVVLAGVWALLCFSAYWRHAALPGIAWAGAMLYQMFCCYVGWPGRGPFIRPGSDWLAEVFRSPAPVMLLGVGLILLALESQLWPGPLANRYLARRGFGALHTLLVCGLLIGLLLWVGRFIDYDMLFFNYYNSKASLPEMRAWAPSIGWPLQAAGISCPIPALEQTFSQPGASALVLFRLIALRGLMLLGFPLFLCVIFSGHARIAVWLARRGAA
jgi:hypothetical protein